MLRAVAFASCYVYSPTGAGSTCESSRLLRTLLKAGDANFMRRYALRVRQQCAESPVLMGYFGASDILVPIPGSSPQNMGIQWIAECLADALVSEGLGRGTWSGLRRLRAVRKSATAAAGKRPTVGLHYESFSIEATQPQGRIVLIDDVITKGRTLLAAANRLHDAFPSAEIRAFALLRTMGMVAGVEQLLDPCRGEIRWRGGDANRSP